MFQDSVKSLVTDPRLMQSPSISSLPSVSSYQANQADALEISRSETPAPAQEPRVQVVESVKQEARLEPMDTEQLNSSVVHETPLAFKSKKRSRELEQLQQSRHATSVLNSLQVL